MADDYYSNYNDWRQDNPQPSSWSPLSTITEPIFWTLHQFDRPRNAIATGAMEYAKGGGVGDILSGMYRGAIPSDRKTISMGDVFGIPEGKPTDDWGTWAANTGKRFALDLVSDPLMWATGLGKLVPGAGASLMKAARVYDPWLQFKDNRYVGAFGQFLGQKLPTGLARNAETEAIWARAAETEATHDINKLRLAAEKNQQAIIDAQKTLGRDITHPEIIEAYERGAKDPVLQQLVDNLLPLKQAKEAAFKERNLGLEYMGRPTYEPFANPNLEHFPRIPTNEMVARKQMANRFPNASSTNDVVPNMAMPLDRMGVLVEKGNPQNILAKGKLEDIRTGIDPIQVTVKGVPAEFRRGSFEEMSQLMPPNSWIENPVAALGQHANLIKGQNKWLRFVGGMLDSGQFIDSTLIPTAKNFGTKLNIPGWDHIYASSPAIASRAEKLAKMTIDPSTPYMGMVGELLDKAASSKGGQALGDLTTWWKRSTLGLHPGYHLANLISNIQQSYAAGVNPLMIIPRAIEAAMVQAGKGPNVMEGIANAALKDSSIRRDAIGSGLFGEVRKQTQDAVGGGYGNKLQNWADKFENPLLSYPAQGIAKVGQGIGKLQDLGLAGGTAIENNARLSVMIDWLKKNAPDVGKLAPELQAKKLDQAAEYTKRALIDYNALTPAEENIRKLVMPFYAWNRGILGRTYELAKTNPEKLANLDRFYNAVSIPVSPEDKKLMPDWMKDQGPMRGMFGYRDPKNIWLAGRFAPQGNIEQMYNDLPGFAFSALNPFAKMPIELFSNKNTFMNKPIDDVAGGAGEGLYNWMTGKIPGVKQKPFERADREYMGWNPPATVAYLLSQLPGGRYLNEASKLVDTAGLTNNKLERQLTPAEYALWYGTGSKAMPFDPDRALKWKASEEKTKIDAITRELKSRMNKGDAEGVNFYQDMLQRAMEDAQFYSGKRGRASGAPASQYGIGGSVGDEIARLARKNVAEQMYDYSTRSLPGSTYVVPRFNYSRPSGLDYEMQRTLNQGSYIPHVRISNMFGRRY